MSDKNDGTGGDEGGGGPGDGRREWPADYRVAFAELLVDFKDLEGMVKTSEARTETVFERVEASIAQLGKEAAAREGKIASEAAAREGKIAAEAAAREGKIAAEAAARENRIVRWIVGVAAVATTVLGAGMAALTLFGPSIGN